MNVCAFIGDEITGAGFRLAGAQVHTPTAGQTGDLFRRLRDTHELVILTAEAAGQVPGELLRQAAEPGRPLVLLVADANARNQAPDLAARVREQLGMSE